MSGEGPSPRVRWAESQTMGVLKKDREVFRAAGGIHTEAEKILKVE